MTPQPFTSPPEPPQCQQAFATMPWLVNGTAPVHEARELEAHVAQCARCHDRLETERQLFATLRGRAGNVQQAPLAAWTRFEASVAAASAPGSSSAPQAAAPVAPESNPALSRSGRRHPLRLALTLQAAAIALLSVALLWVLVARSPDAPPGTYRTVASPDTTLDAGGLAWRVVFEPATAAREAVPLLAARGLAVLAGPSADGVYTVVPRAGAAPQIDALRADRRVRLLESVGPSSPVTPTPGVP